MSASSTTRATGLPGAEGRAASRRVRVMLVDDHPVVLEGVGRIIDSQPDLSVCGTASCCREAWGVLTSTQPDVLLIDITLSDGDGLDFVHRASRQFVNLRALVLSMHDEFLYADRALRAGAYGYVMKDAARDVYLQAIRSVAAGGFFFSRKAEASLVLPPASSEGDALESRLRQLSDRELQVFHLMGKGWTTARIAGSLGISPSTVETHRTHLREKLGQPSMAELTRCAVTWLSSGRGRTQD
jgi:DNA-binding NarL/FixJ family response regulator